MASAYTQSLIKGFVQNYGSDIVRAITNTGLYFPAVVGQLSVESANGTSYLSQNANNFGGFKGDASNGILMDTVEGNNRVPTKAYFKRYDNFPQFMADYVSQLQADRYVNAGVFTASSPEDQISRMVAAGYSTMTPKAYLATGVKDRINATRDLFGLGKIVDYNQGAADNIVSNPDNSVIYNVFDAAVSN